jgi:2-polyprenyl-3-methyl-5-hydroxy-6-metoxy-1,4-benzoquinol methylase
MTFLEHRIRASQLSGGTSSQAIKSLVLRIIREKGLRGSVLDFGAGLGELAGRLFQEEGFADVTGVDLFDRPADLPPEIGWYRQDLNDEIGIDRTFDIVICSEVIEHLENPRAVLRSIHHLLRPAGALVLTTPNQESIRSLLSLWLRGHFVAFLDNSYPAHITALLRVDLARICAETLFTHPEFFFTNHGSIPKCTWLTWQRASFGLLGGLRFSDNLGIVAYRSL